ncbi:hypothetical protein [Natrinema salinisoli]|uniref:hypothetical protein n=1 Tax=Natrinema salinisoli TaxID=2878535 RepID=UPI001CEFF158|nr:hypothetical protein [Natrinema salinisoli]
MSQDITPRVLQLFKIKLKNHPDISAETVEGLLQEQGKNDFGDDDELLDTVVEMIEDDE